MSWFCRNYWKDKNGWDQWEQKFCVRRCQQMRTLIEQWSAQGWLTEVGNKESQNYWFVHGKGAGADKAGNRLVGWFRKYLIMIRDFLDRLIGD